ncbi:hypothetical protein TNCV_1485881 [Trichonephila clavipes]|nr:hypothetical protein TNCV_1485881 [Trichonephila clavipes]
MQCTVSTFKRHRWGLHVCGVPGPQEALRRPCGIPYNFELWSSDEDKTSELVLHSPILHITLMPVLQASTETMFISHLYMTGLQSTSPKATIKKPYKHEYIK